MSMKRKTGFSRTGGSQRMGGSRTGSPRAGASARGDRGDIDPILGAARRKKRVAKFIIPKEIKIDYKDIPFLQKYLTDRGKILSRRITGISAKDQRQIAAAIKRARFLGLLSVGGYRKS